MKYHQSGRLKREEDFSKQFIEDNFNHADVLKLFGGTAYKAEEI
jgi:hypothetical protein